MRCVGYVRVSSDEQVNNYSLDAQRRAIEKWIEGQDKAVLVNVYADEGYSAKTSERPAFQQVRRDAARGEFDALVVHKWDRFARNREDAILFKSFLRRDYGIKVFSATESSQDSDGAMGMLVESILEAISQWYSLNLATEVSKGIQEKHRRGLHVGHAPFGYQKNKDGVLVPHPDEKAGAILIFEQYATGNNSYSDIARILTEHGFRSKRRRNFTKEGVREILRNGLYVGRVSYQKTRYNRNGTRNFTAPVHWEKGQHEALISESLWEQCQHVRQLRASAYHGRQARYSYLLKGRVHCARCEANPPENPRPSWGKMHCKTHIRHHGAYYVCNSRTFGRKCDQPGVRVDVIDKQVLKVLVTLEFALQTAWRENLQTIWLEHALSREQLDSYKVLAERISRLDFRFDNGFIDREPYFEQRTELQDQQQELAPEPDHELVRTLELLGRFSEEWARCNEDVNRQHRFLGKLINRVSIMDIHLQAMEAKGGLKVIFNNPQTRGGDNQASNQVNQEIQEQIIEEVAIKKGIFQFPMWSIKWAQRGLETHVCPSSIWFVPDHLHVRSIPAPRRVIG